MVKYLKNKIYRPSSKIDQKSKKNLWKKFIWSILLTIIAGILNIAGKHFRIIDDGFSKPISLIIFLLGISIFLLMIYNLIMVLAQKRFSYLQFFSKKITGMSLNLMFLPKKFDLRYQNIKKILLIGKRGNNKFEEMKIIFKDSNNKNLLKSINFALSFFSRKEQDILIKAMGKFKVKVEFIVTKRFESTDYNPEDSLDVFGMK